MRLIRALLATVVLASCSKAPMVESESSQYNDREDHHSYSRPQQCRVRHLDLNLDVSFERKILSGSAILTVDASDSARPLVVDTRDLNIRSVSASADGNKFDAAQFKLADVHKILGAPLTIDLPPRVTRVRIEYDTNPNATGLQWLTPAQTAGKKLPFLYSQSQAIHARSWIPIQDSPGIRMTYSATVRTPKSLRAVMSLA